MASAWACIAYGFGFFGLDACSGLAVGLRIVLVLMLVLGPAEAVRSSPGTLEAARGVGKIALESKKLACGVRRDFVGKSRWLCGLNAYSESASQTASKKIDNHN